MNRCDSLRERALRRKAAAIAAELEAAARTQADRIEQDLAAQANTFLSNVNTYASQLVGPLQQLAIASLDQLSDRRATKLIDRLRELSQQPRAASDR